MGRWGENVVRRFGPDGLARVRARLAPPLDQLAPVLTSRDWIPIYAQVEVTEAIVDELLDGHVVRLYPLLVEDTRAGLGRLDLVLLRAMGAARAFKLAPRGFRKVHDRGNVEVEVDESGRRARLQFSGCPLFGHPTWRILQLYAQRVLLELCGTPGSADGEAASDDEFTVIARWGRAKHLESPASPVNEPG